MIDAVVPGSLLAGEQLRVFPSPLLKFAVLREAKEYFSCDLSFSLSLSQHSVSSHLLLVAGRLGENTGLAPGGQNGWGDGVG